MLTQKLPNQTLLSTLVSKASGRILRDYNEIKQLQNDTGKRKEYLLNTKKFCVTKLIDYLDLTYPDYGIVAEKQIVKYSQEKSNIYVVIDLIVGTDNFLRGLPFFINMFSIVAKKKTENDILDPHNQSLLATFIDSPEIKHHCLFLKNKDITCNDIALKTSQISSLVQAKIYSDSKNIKQYQTLMLKYQHNIISLNCPMLAILYFISGNIDIIYLPNIIKNYLYYGLVILNHIGAVFLQKQKKVSLENIDENSELMIATKHQWSSNLL